MDLSGLFLTLMSAAEEDLAKQIDIELTRLLFNRLKGIVFPNGGEIKDAPVQSLYKILSEYGPRKVCQYQFKK